MKKTFLIIALIVHLCFGEEIDLGNVEIPDIDDFSVIKEKCDKGGGNGTYDKLKASKESLQTCLTNFVDVNTLKNEVEEAKKTGSMDEVFGKYCAKRSKVATCVENFTNSLRPCLNAEEKKALNITLDILKQLGEFVCFRDGDRIAMFIAEGGVECIQSHTSGIQSCVNSTFKINAKDVNTNSLPNLLMDKKKCDDLGTLQNCVVEELEKCKDSTPANIVDALFKFIKRSACANKNKRSVPFHSILKRSAAITNDLYDPVQVKTKFLNLFKLKCTQNAPDGGFEAFNETLETTIHCLRNKTKRDALLVTSLDTFKKNIEKCVGALIEKTEACLPDDEKYWPKFYRDIVLSMIDFVYANKDTLIRTSRTEIINCFQNFKQQHARNELVKCLNISETTNMQKEVICGRLTSLKTCVSEQLKTRCVHDIAIKKLNDDFFTAATSPCNTN